MRNKKLSYLLDSILSVTPPAAQPQESRYALRIGITPLKEMHEDAVIYDKNMRMYFEDVSATSTIYEIEVENMFLALNGSLQKSSDFLRRTMFRYDWMQLRINKQGCVLSIENESEITKQWNELKNMICADYKGQEVHNYLEKIDAQMKTPFLKEHILNCYSYLGLLFPEITINQNNKQERIITLSDFEDIHIEEQIMKGDVVDGNYCMYNIETQQKNDSQVDRMTGYMILSHKDMFPVEAQIEIIYKEGLTRVQRNFKLTQN